MLTAHIVWGLGATVQLVLTITKSTKWINSMQRP